MKALLPASVLLLVLVPLACSPASPGDPATNATPPPAPSATAQDASPPPDAAIDDGGIIGDGGALRLTCPKKAPFDTTIPGLLEQCTKRVLIAALDGAKLSLSSNDGATWTDPVSLDPAMVDPHVFNFATGNGLVVAMTRGGLYTSTDAKTWTLAPSTAPAAYNYSGFVLFADGRFASSGNGGSFGSDDGISWMGYGAREKYPSGATAGVETFGMGFFAGQWILAGRERDTNVALYRTSSDGLGWSVDKNVGTAPRQGAYGSVNVVQDQVFVVGAGIVARTTDGSLWSESANTTVNFAVSDGKRSVGFAASQTFTSTDGITWTKLGDAPTLYNAIFVEGTWFGLDERSWYTSPDAVKWTAVLTPPTSNYVATLGYARILK